MCVGEGVRDCVCVGVCVCVCTCVCMRALLYVSTCVRARACQYMPVCMCSLKKNFKRYIQVVFTSSTLSKDALNNEFKRRLAS